VPATNISAWWRQTVSDLTGAFNGPGYSPEPPSACLLGGEDDRPRPQQVHQRATVSLEVRLPDEAAAGPYWWSLSRVVTVVPR
jgi:hypothetical protein